MSQESLKQIKQQLEEIDDLNHPIWDKLKEDPRKGSQILIQKRRKQLMRYQAQYEAYKGRLIYEEEILRHNPGAIIAGVDEVGRGPLAGPVVTAAVVLPDDTSSWVEVTDSKQLSHAKRIELATLIQAEAKAYAICRIEPIEIDQLNIYQAAKLAMERAVHSLSIPASHVLVDAMTLNLPINQLSLIKGDDKSLSIAAASILAKVYRDQIMMDYHQQYPEYSFDKHMGYPTKDHLLALDRYGVTPIHRLSYQPVQNHYKAGNYYQK